MNHFDTAEDIKKDFDMQPEYCNSCICQRLETHFQQMRNKLPIEPVDPKAEEFFQNQRGARVYATDYVFINAVKELADRYGICLILVHHTRKSADSDIFKMLSGSMGITAAVDGSMVLYKKERKSPEATLAVVGREIRDRELNLVRDWDSPKWELVDEEDYVNLPSLPDKILLAVSALLSDERPLWIGSADALVKATGLEMSPNALSRYLGSHVTELKKEYFIDFSKGRTNSGRSIRLMYGEDKPLTKRMCRLSKSHGTSGRRTGSIIPVIRHRQSRSENATTSSDNLQSINCI